jgi:hypothetical protein
MVDRSCDWVQLSREYHEQTGDTALVRAIWPAVARQLDAFLAKRTSRGLIQLEEWADWGNHYKYRVFEGTALNSFMYAALVDGAYLGQVAGDASASRFAQAAAALRKTMLAELWDPQAKTFGAGLYTVDPAKPEPRQGTYAGPSSGVGLCAATRHAAIYALRWGVVDDARREALYQWIWNDRDQVMKGENAAMVVYHLIHLLYERDDPAADAWVLDCIRTKWAAQLTSPLQTSGESLGTNGTIHCYSMYPTYLLSQFVLGVRLDGLVERKALTIDPRLGGLPNASGTVVTALGLVPVTWTTTADGGLDFAVTVPAGATATVRLPTTRTAITLDGASVTASRFTKGRPVLTLGPGEHRGTVR